MMFKRIVRYMAGWYERITAGDVRHVDSSKAGIFVHKYRANLVSLVNQASSVTSVDVDLAAHVPERTKFAYLQVRFRVRTHNDLEIVYIYPKNLAWAAGGYISIDNQLAEYSEFQHQTMIVRLDNRKFSYVFGNGGRAIDLEIVLLGYIE